MSVPTPNHQHTDHGHAHGEPPAPNAEDVGGTNPAADVLATKVFFGTVIGTITYVGVVILFVLMGKL
jgi:hypothetical protein